MLVKDFISAYYGKLDCVVSETGSDEPLFSSSNRDFLISFVGEYNLVQWDFEVYPTAGKYIFHLSVEKRKPISGRLLRPEEYEEKIRARKGWIKKESEEAERKNQEFLESLNEIPAPSKYDNHDIRNLKLPARVMNRLTEFGIESVGDLRNFSRKDLLEVKGLAKRGVDIIEHRLYQLGLGLKKGE